MQLWATAQQERPFPAAGRPHAGSRVGAPGQSRDAGWTEGCPESALPPAAQPVLLLWSQKGLDALPRPPWAGGQSSPAGIPFCFSKDWFWRKALLQWPPPQRPTLPPEAPVVLSHAPDVAISCLMPRSPRRPEEYWNVPCLRSEPEFDLSWVEMRGKCQEQLTHLLHFQTWRLPGLGFQTKLALAWTSAVPATRHIWVCLGS